MIEKIIHIFRSPHHQLSILQSRDIWNLVKVAGIVIGVACAHVIEQILECDRSDLRKDCQWYATDMRATDIDLGVGACTQTDKLSQRRISKQPLSPLVCGSEPLYTELILVRTKVWLGKF